MFISSITSLFLKQTNNTISEVSQRINNKRKHIGNTSNSVNQLALMRVLMHNTKRTRSLSLTQKWSMDQTTKRLHFRTHTP